MNCREFVEFLMEYLDGSLPDAQHATFEAHMHECIACVDFLDTYCDTIRLGRCVCDEPEGTVHAEAPEELVSAILAARQTGS